MDNVEKLKKYEELLTKRRADCFGAKYGFVNPWLDDELRAEDERRNAVDFIDFQPDCPPQHERNLNVDVLILGQDFANVESVQVFVRTGRWQGKDFFNDNLNPIKKALGLEKRSFTSNLVPFFKKQSMSAGIPQALIKHCAKEYGQELINIVQPKIVYLLGKRVTLAMFSYYKLDVSKPFYEMVNAPPQRISGGIWLLPVSHPGGMGWANRQPQQGVADRKEQHLADWKRGSDLLKVADSTSV
jgi:uracil-DNA glycosylase